MEIKKEKIEEQSKKSSEVEIISKFFVKANQKLITKKFHQPFQQLCSKKFREGQKSRKRVTKCKISVVNRLLRCNNRGTAPWIR